MAITVRRCQPEELPEIIGHLDQEFIFRKGRTGSLAVRFPAVFSPDNLENVFVGYDASGWQSVTLVRKFNWLRAGDNLRVAMIGGVFTRPAARGAGAGSVLLDAIASELAAEGIQHGVLWTTKPDFYSRLGWVPSDRGVFGQVVLDASAGTSPTELMRLGTEHVATLESVRARYLRERVDRSAHDYLARPIPCDAVEVALGRHVGGEGYALVGRLGAVGYLYEMVGDVTCFSSIWRQLLSAGFDTIYVNDESSSQSFGWFTGRGLVEWKPQRLAMWLNLRPSAVRADIPNCDIGFFDRI